jgi:tetratricopeptide (TPR) repeat protein
MAPEDGFLATAEIEEGPSEAWLFWERGKAHADVRRWKDAIDDYTRAILLEPDEPEFWLSRGRIRYHIGHTGLAEEDLGRGIELDPEDDRSYAIRGQCRSWWCGSRDDAVADFRRAIELSPLTPSYRHSRGIVWQRLGDLKRALEDFDEAVRLDPEQAPYYHSRAMARLYDGPEGSPLEEALPDLEEAIRLAPDTSWYRKERGYIRFCQGRWADAAEDFAKQDYRYAAERFPFLGATMVVWLYLARLFQGRSGAGLGAVQDYFHWYLHESAGHGRDDPPGKKLGRWPVPLARLVAGEVDGQQLLALKRSELSRPNLVESEIETIEEAVKECHFVLAELALAAGRRGEATTHLGSACGLPRRNPMSWVVAHHWAVMPERYGSSAKMPDTLAT